MRCGAPATDAMKLRKAQRRQASDEPLIPLINIVFLLLIFFMLAGSFSTAERFDVTPPRSQSAAPVPAPQMVVLLAADGRLAIGTERVDRVQLRRRLTRRLAVEPNLQVQLKADARLPAERLLEITDLCRALGLERLVLLTVAGQG